MRANVGLAFLLFASSFSPITLNLSIDLHEINAPSVAFHHRIARIRQLNFRLSKQTDTALQRVNQETLPTNSLRCRGGGEGSNKTENDDVISTAPATSDLNFTEDESRNESSFDKYIWSPEFAKHGHDPLFMEGLSESQAEYARNEWLKQVRYIRLKQAYSICMASSILRLFSCRL
jgi:hypothetical protein